MATMVGPHGETGLSLLYKSSTSSVSDAGAYEMVTVWDSVLSLWLTRVMAAVVLPQARWRRKCRSPLQGSALDPWAPRREDSKGSEPDSWGDFRSLTEAPIARLESLDEMESLSVSSWQRKPNHRIPPTHPIPLPALPTPPHTRTHFMHESTHCRLMVLAPVSVAMFSNALTSIITCITSTFSVSYMYYVYPDIYSSPNYSKYSCGSVQINMYSRINSYHMDCKEYLFFCISIKWNMFFTPSAFMIFSNV